MIEVTGEVIINLPQPVVFDYITDPANMPVWRRGCVEGRLEGGTLQPGATIVSVREIHGGRFEAVQTVAEYEPYSRFFTTEEKGEPFAVDGGFMLEPEGAGTRLTYMFTAKTGKKVGMMGPAAKSMFSKAVKGDIDNLKTVMESQPELAAQGASRPAVVEERPPVPQAQPTPPPVVPDRPKVRVERRPVVPAGTPFLVPDDVAAPRYKLPGAITTVGRNPTNALRLESPGISRHHAVIKYSDGRIILTDLDSTNGTFVNDTPATGTVELHDGDRIQFGGAKMGVGFVLRIEDAITQT